MNKKLEVGDDRVTDKNTYYIIKIHTKILF